MLKLFGSQTKRIVIKMLFVCNIILSVIQFALIVINLLKKLIKKSSNKKMNWN